MKILLFGGTGFIGRSLHKALITEGHEPIVFSRNVEKAKSILGESTTCVEFIFSSNNSFRNYFCDKYAVINLVGENLTAGRWTRHKKREIINSRTLTTRKIVDLINEAQESPAVFMQGSAIGYYGASEDFVFNESAPPGEGFLSKVVQEWEASLQSLPAEFKQIFLRTGVVIGKEDGILKKLLPLFRSCLGGHPGNGKQWISWISLTDQIRAILFLLNHSQLEGVFNLTSPHPVSMKEFCNKLGHSISRPSWLHQPGWLLKVLLGEMADEMLLSGQKAIPEKLMKTGFDFQHKTIEDILHFELNKGSNE